MEPNQVVIYVKDGATSRSFYGKTLGYDVKQLSPNFSVASLGNGWSLAILERDGTDDSKPIGGFELVIELESRDAVDAALTNWRSKDVTIVEELADVPYGYTFVGTDPDGVRLRVGHFPQG